MTGKALLLSSWQKLRQRLPAILAVAFLSEAALFLLYRCSHRLTNAGMQHLPWPPYFAKNQRVYDNKLRKSCPALIDVYMVVASSEGKAVLGLSTVAWMVQWRWGCWARDTLARQWATYGSSVITQLWTHLSAVCAFPSRPHSI